MLVFFLSLVCGERTVMSQLASFCCSSLGFARGTITSTNCTISSGYLPTKKEASLRVLYSGRASI